MSACLSRSGRSTYGSAWSTNNRSITISRAPSSLSVEMRSACSLRGHGQRWTRSRAWSLMSTITIAGWASIVPTWRKCRFCPYRSSGSSRPAARTAHAMHVTAVPTTIPHPNMRDDLRVVILLPLYATRGRAAAPNRIVTVSVGPSRENRNVLEVQAVRMARVGGMERAGRGTKWSNLTRAPIDQKNRS